jgi:hypothetical protein
MEITQITRNFVWKLYEITRNFAKFKPLLKIGLSRNSKVTVLNTLLYALHRPLPPSNRPTGRSLHSAAPPPSLHPVTLSLFLAFNSI